MLYYIIMNIINLISIKFDKFDLNIGKTRYTDN